MENGSIHEMQMTYSNLCYFREHVKNIRVLTYSHNNLCASTCIKFEYDLLHHFVQLSIRLLTTGGALADS